MASTIAVVTSSGAGRPGTAAVVMTASLLPTYGVSSSTLLLGPLLGHLAGIAAGAFQRLEVRGR